MARLIKYLNVAHLGNCIQNNRIKIPNSETVLDNLAAFIMYMYNGYNFVKVETTGIFIKILKITWKRMSLAWL